MAAALTVQQRPQRGKNAMRRLREQGLVPAVLYGHGDETRALSVSAHELEKLLASISVANTLIELAVEGGRKTRALIREVQHHPSRRMILHVDFLQVHAEQKIHLEVPIRLHGTPVGVSETRGVLQTVLHSVSVECLPADIPEGFDVDVQGLEIGGTVHVRDLGLPKVVILTDPELVVAAVVPPTLEPEPTGEAPEEVEPEVIAKGTGEGGEAGAGEAEAEAGE